MRAQHCIADRRTRRAQRRSAASGFTLIESALATVIIGVGVLAIVAAQEGLHRKNTWSTHASIATRLGNEIREMTLNLPRHDPVTGTAVWGQEGNETWVGDFDDIDDFDGDGDGIIFAAEDDTGPINARREVIANMDGWAQTVFVRNVDPFDITVGVDDGASNVMLVEVVITFQGPLDDDPREMTRVSWVVPN